VSQILALSIATMLFPSVLGAEFAALDPCFKWVHSGEPRRLRGSVTVERGTGFVARARYRDRGRISASMSACMRSLYSSDQ
jgi:hypothetical protein